MKLLVLIIIYIYYYLVQDKYVFKNSLNVIIIKGEKRELLYDFLE